MRPDPRQLELVLAIGLGVCLAFGVATVIDHHLEHQAHQESLERAISVWTDDGGRTQ